MWVNGYLNQHIDDICKDLAKENRQEWQNCLKKLSDNGKCPFLKVIPYTNIRNRCNLFCCGFTERRYFRQL